MQIVTSWNCQQSQHHWVIHWDQISHRECGQDSLHCLYPSVQGSGPQGLAQVSLHSLQALHFEHILAQAHWH